MSATMDQNGSAAVARRDQSSGEIVTTGGAMVQAASTRAAQEVQAAMVVAKQFPRNEDQALDRIVKSCARYALAEAATYRYPKGGTDVTGPSIRLAEVLAQNWGNVDFGIVELESANGESSMMAYAWDLETNTRSTKVFRVPHKIKTKRGTKNLNDPRDVYELTANQGARRMRACILAVIPGDIVDAALLKCNQTLIATNGELAAQIEKMIVAFSGIGVTQEMIQKRLGHKVEACTPQQVVELRGVYQSINDEMSAISDWFEAVEKPAPAATSPPKQATGSEFAQPAPASVPEPLRTALAQVDAATTLDELRAVYNSHVGPDSPLPQGEVQQVSDACDLRKQQLVDEAAPNQSQAQPDWLAKIDAATSLDAKKAIVAEMETQAASIDQDTMKKAKHKLELAKW